MKTLNALQRKTTKWLWSIIAAAIWLPLSINVTAQSPPPTSPLVVNVKDKGATGNGVTDDTPEIQSAVDQIAGTGGTVFVPVGTYMINALTSVNLKNNMTLKMERGAILKAIPNGSGGYKIINVLNLTNVNIIGGTLQGERHQHLTSGDYYYGKAPDGPESNGQWGMGINISGSSDIYIEGVTAKECWGDGIYIGGSSGSTDITLSGVVCDDNRRQGCSITGADGVLIQNSSFNNTGGHSPHSGIDIEPNSGQVAKNIRILNCHFINNVGAGIILHSSASPNPEISDITVIGNTISTIKWGFSSNNARSGITVSNNTITGCTREPMSISGSKSINNIYSYNTIWVSPAIGGDIAAITFTNGATGNSAIHNTISGYPYGVKDKVGGNTINPNP